MTTPVHDGPIDLHDQHGEQQSGRYRVVSPMAVASLIFGVLSALTVWHRAMVLIPVVGVLTGFLALRRIAKTPEELTGRWVAQAGMIVSVVFGVLGISVLMVAKAREFPRGYQPVTYGMLQPNREVPGERIPPSAYELQDKKVGVKGYMAPTRYQTGLKQFILCPSIPNCSFCTPNPKPTEMILVRLEGDLEARYTTHEIRVSGRFRVDETPGGLPYRLDANDLR